MYLASSRGRSHPSTCRLLRSMKLPWGQNSSGSGSGPSTSAPTSAPKRHNPQKYPASVLTTPQQQKQTRKNLAWAASREQMFAAAAAGIHLAAFAYNLAFWGVEGMPPDRYWPGNTRLKMGVKPGRFGNLVGTKRVWYDNLSAMEGV